MTFDEAIAKVGKGTVARCKSWPPNFIVDRVREDMEHMSVWQLRLGNDWTTTKDGKRHHIVAQGFSFAITPEERAAEWEVLPVHKVERLDNPIGVR